MIKKKLKIHFTGGSVIVKPSKIEKGGYEVSCLTKSPAVIYNIEVEAVSSEGLRITSYTKSMEYPIKLTSGTGCLVVLPHKSYLSSDPKTDLAVSNKSKFKDVHCGGFVGSPSALVGETGPASVMCKAFINMIK